MARSLLCALLVVAALQCDEGLLDVNLAPMAAAGRMYAVSGTDSLRVNLAVAGVGRLFALYGTATDADGAVVEKAWLVEGAAEFVATRDDSLVITVPAVEDSDFVCVFRATDDQGASTTDTLHVWVVRDPDVTRYRIARPANDETYRVGDTLSIVLWPAPGLAGLSLVVDGEYECAVGNNMRLPDVNPVTWFIIPSVFMTSSGALSVVSDTCSVRVFEYTQPSISIYSPRFAITR